jgi:hypothetical protein
MEKIHLQITLSDVGYSSFKRRALLCTQREREARALRWNIMIESRKRFLEAHKN